MTVAILYRRPDKRSIRCGECAVTIDYPPSPSYVVTLFPDGKTVVAAPQDAAEYQSRAKSLGYPSGDEMNREHDPLHSFLSAKLGKPYSPTLYAACHGIADLSGSQRDREEALVLAFQRYMNDESAVHAALSLLTDAGLNLSELRTEALGLLR